MSTNAAVGLDRHARAGPFENGPGVIDPPVAIGGAVVFPGDLIVTDSDGGVVVPHHRAG